jgi:hypothetical protein
MAEVNASAKTSLEETSFDTIPYDAPLTHLRTAPLMRVPPPAQLASWARRKSHAGANSEHLTVPAADLKGKRVIITGSNSGIGREAAIQMATWGANIVLGCRPNPPPHEMHPDKVVAECIQAANQAGHLVEIEWWPIDNADLKSVDAFAKRWLDGGHALDILCSNIGMGAKRPVSKEQAERGEKYQKTVDGFEEIHSVRGSLTSENISRRSCC